MSASEASSSHRAAAYGEAATRDDHSRDGIHGASFASEELTEKSEARRPQVQVGDPFTEKLLLEASLELIHGGLCVAIQDMGAAALTSSSAEMAARGGVGVELDTSRVPTREPGMTPYEILLSESLERMLVVAEPARVAGIEAVCALWELNCAVVGRVTDDGLFRVVHDGLTVAAIPGQRLVDDCPIYQPEARESAAAVPQRGPTPKPDHRLKKIGCIQDYIQRDQPCPTKPTPSRCSTISFRSV